MIQNEYITEKFIKTLTDLVKQLDESIDNVVFDFDEYEIRVYYNFEKSLKKKKDIDNNVVCVREYMNIDIEEEYDALELVCDTLAVFW